jgi:hypothetical protein
MLVGFEFGSNFKLNDFRGRSRGFVAAGAAATASRSGAFVRPRRNPARE